jgi:hypothetical protein
MELQYLMDNTNFRKTKNHFVHFSTYLHFLVHNDVHCFATNIPELHNISWKKEFSL